jgi:hypothetical protein
VQGLPVAEEYSKRACKSIRTLCAGRCMVLAPGVILHEEKRGVKEASGDPSHNSWACHSHPHGL